MVRQKASFTDRRAVTAGEVTTGYAEFEFDFPPNCELINIVCNNVTTQCEIDCLIKAPDMPVEQGMALFHKELQRDADHDIIWEGRQFMPWGWKLIVRFASGIVAADDVRVHGAYEYDK